MSGNRSMNGVVQRQSVAVDAILHDSCSNPLFVSFDLRQNPPQSSRHKRQQDMLVNLTQTIRECLYFWSRHKDGGHTTRYQSYAKNPALHANLMVLIYYRTAVTADWSFTLRDWRKFRHFVLLWPWTRCGDIYKLDPYPLKILSQNKKRIIYVDAFESYRYRGQ